MRMPRTRSLDAPAGESLRSQKTEDIRSGESVSVKVNPPKSEKKPETVISPSASSESWDNISRPFEVN